MAISLICLHISIWAILAWMFFIHRILLKLIKRVDYLEMKEVERIWDELHNMKGK